ncbi:MAG TPA: HNH endonuclease domain-containing protein, partial [Balneolaceae bacterium]|nr:HNH endonuclease domain-containing protein [Balneolaceae bacterium]
QKIGGSKRRGDDRDGILFYQRPLRSQKHLISNCTFETHKPRSKKSIIPFELFRTYQLANSIRVDGYPLIDQDREKVIEILHSRKRNPSFSTIRKKLSNPDGNYNFSDDNKFPSNNTIYNFRKIFGKRRWNDFTLEQQEEIWHIKYMADDPEWLEQYAKDRWGLSDKKIERLKSFKLDDDYANLSRKAIMNILPYLERGLLYDKAVLLGGLKSAYGTKNWEQMGADLKKEIEQQVLGIANDSEHSEKTIDRVKQLLVEQYNLPKKKTPNLYHHSITDEVEEIKGKLPEPDNVRNPIVQQALHEVNTVVNAIIDKHGKPDEIKVELARELKSSKEHRKRIRDRQQEREEENIAIKATLDEFGLKHTRRNIHKVKLYNEIVDKAGQPVNPFNPEQTFGIEDLLSRDGFVQIEHIIPESISLDDSLANKTLCGANTNRAKGNKTPYQYFMSQGMSQKEWENYKDRIFKILPFYKAQKFVSEEEPELDDFIQRQLNDTRYISKLAKTYLQQICPRVDILQGSVTAMLRYYWGMNGILGGKYEVGNLQDGEYLAAVDSEDKIIEIVEWDEETLDKDQKRLEDKGQFLQGNVSNGIFYPFKQRIDHRHHAVDAIAVACSKRKYLQQISRLSAKGWNNEAIKENYEVEQPWDGFWEDAKNAIDQILVSHKQNDRILTKVKKQLFDYDGNPKTDDDGNELYAEGHAARGRLHRETVYGRHSGPDGETYYHHRKPIDFIKKYKHLEKVVSPRVRKAVENRLNYLGLNTSQNKKWKLSDLPKEKRNQVFFIFEERNGRKKRIPQIRLPNKNGDDIPVKKVRVRETISRAQQLKDGVNQFVDPYDNHHLMVYKNQEGELDLDVVTFWETVELKNQAQPIFKLPFDGEKIVSIVQENEMFLVGLEDVLLRDNLDNPSYLRDYLYRVQKISISGYNIVFRHHTASTIDDPTQMIGISSMGDTKSGWQTHNPTKVEISALGEIEILD